MQSNSPAARLLEFHRAHGITAVPRTAANFEPSKLAMHGKASAQRRARRHDVSLEPGGILFFALLLITALLASWAATDLDAMTIGSAPSAQQAVR